MEAVLKVEIPDPVEVHLDGMGFEGGGEGGDEEQEGVF